MSRLELIEIIKSLNYEDLEWLKTQIDDLQTLKNTAELNKDLGKIGNTNNMVELVIKMPEDVFKKTVFYREFRDLNDSITTIKALEKAVLLPKGHGRLKDADKIANEVNALKDNWNRYGNEYESGRYESYDYAVDTIDNADTIIKADTQNVLEKRRCRKGFER